MSSGHTWTDSETASLRLHWEKGLSCTQIGLLLGMTRNAIIGRAHRLGLEKRERVSTVRGGEMRARRRPTNQVRGEHLAPLCKSALRCVEVDARHLTIPDLSAGDCRWPYGDGPFTFCGRQIFCGSYCADHHFLSIGEGSPGERSALRVLRSMVA